MYLMDDKKEIRIEDVLDKVVKMIRASENIVVLTGAGMSVDSGIPAFRTDDGLYSKYPSDVLSRSYFYSKPDKFYEAFNEKFKQIFTAKPNDGHNIIAKWQKDGIVSKIMTQNIDQLHQEAIDLLDISDEERKRLITDVYEIHGTIKTFTVKARGKLYKLKLEDVLKEDNTIEYRREIEGIPGKYLVKPDVVLFGEEIKHYNKSSDFIHENSDLMIILGTSLEVFPFANLPYHMRKTKPIIVINKTPVELQRNSCLQIQDDITKSLKLIDEALKA